MTKPTGNRRGPKTKYPFASLAVGEHFDVVLQHMGHRNSVASSACRYGRLFGGVYRTYMFSQFGKAHVRVTRIA